MNSQSKTQEVIGHPDSSASLRYFVRSQINGRDANEDSFLTLALRPSITGKSEQELYILAIADGMGGHAHGEEISYQALKKLSLSLFEQLIVNPNLNRERSLVINETETIKQAIQNALEQVNAYAQTMVKNNHWGTAGSTLVLIVVQGDQGIVANLGDSPLFHYQVSDQQLDKPCASFSQT